MIEIVPIEIRTSWNYFDLQVKKSPHENVVPEGYYTF